MLAKVLEEPANENQNTPGQYLTNHIWFVFNLEYTFYSCEHLRNVIGFYPGAQAFDETSPITDIKINNVSELAKIGALGELNCTLRPNDKLKTYGSLGLIHKTSFYFCLDKSIQEVASFLKTIKINVAESGVLYEVVPGSLSLKKRKKTSNFSCKAPLRDPVFKDIFLLYINNFPLSN